MTIEEIQARRDARKAGAKAARDVQYALDLEALDSLEEEHGDGRVAQLDLPSFVAGLPTMVVVKAPSSAHYKRFMDMLRRAGDSGEAKGKAQDLLADSCIAYPDAETMGKVHSAFPAVRNDIALAAVTLAKSKSIEEGKA